MSALFEATFRDPDMKLYNPRTPFEADMNVVVKYCENLETQINPYVVGATRDLLKNTYYTVKANEIDIEPITLMLERTEKSLSKSGSHDSLLVRQTQMSQRKLAAMINVGRAMNYLGKLDDHLQFDPVLGEIKRTLHSTAWMRM